MRRLAPVLLLWTLGCPEPPSASTASPQTGSDTPGEAGEAGAPTADAFTVRVRGTSVSAGDKTVQARPAEAPGVMTPEFRATYAYAELGPAPEEVVPDVRVEATTPVSTVRGVFASVLAPGGHARLSQGNDAAVVVTRPAETGPTAIVRPRRGGWELRLGTGLRAKAETIEALGSAVAGLDPKTLEAGVALDLPDTATAKDLIAAATMVTTAVEGTPAVLAFEYDPCIEPPDGMACVPGGPAIVGYDDGAAVEKPEREIVLSTYYIDKLEVTNAQYDECHKAGACKIRINRYQNIMKPFVAEDQPAMPMDWHRARSYCAWKGKRLPSEWEWEKAARGPDGDLFPWGNDEPSCDKAIYRECAPYGCTPYPGKSSRWDCNEHATKAVGSYPAGHYGLHEMAGNGYEWTASAGIESVTECGDACAGRDPLGPCDGAFPCKGQRILRGGSWYWPKHRMRGSHRRLEKLKTGSHRLGMRCVATGPFLTAYPPLHLAETRDAPALPEAPSDEELAAMAAVQNDTIQDKPICGAKVRENWAPAQQDGGRSETTCRDPFPYLMTNEPRAYHWTGYIENLGGAYVGIGSDQNYSHIAVARPAWAWVVDYDPRVYRNHLRLRAFVMAAETPAEFLKMFAAGNERAALKVLKDAYPDRKNLRHGYTATRYDLYSYFEAKMRPKKAVGDFGWLRNAEHYAFVRTLFLQGRLRPVAGDLLGDKAMTGIGEAARKLGVPVRIYYTSNAPSSWGGQVTDPYRRNVLALPFDELSIVLQTNSRGGFKQTGKWHHNITWGHEMHRRLGLPGYRSIPILQEDRIPGHHGDVTILGIPTGG